jgi:hypothetical protein
MVSAEEALQAALDKYVAEAARQDGRRLDVVCKLLSLQVWLPCFRVAHQLPFDSRQTNQLKSGLLLATDKLPSRH